MNLVENESHKHHHSHHHQMNFHILIMGRRLHYSISEITNVKIYYFLTTTLFEVLQISFQFIAQEIVVKHLCGMR